MTDSLQLIANPLTTVPTSSLLDFLKDYAEREGVELFVMGLPRQTNGKESETLPKAKAFVERLRKAVPGVAVDWWDERYTSVLAHRAILESGIGRKARQNKALADEISACIILQGYMERRKTT